MTNEDILVENLNQIANTFAFGHGVTLGTLSRNSVKDHFWLDRVLNQKLGFTIRVYDKFMAYCSENWIGEEAWPSKIPRPTPLEIAKINRMVATPASAKTKKPQLITV